MTSNADRDIWRQRYAAVRQHTAAIAAPLSAEDQALQSMADTSPAKWHQAHTSWFFETLLLLAKMPGYTAYDTRFGLLFNSYYEALGPRHPRPARGLLSRPGLDEVRACAAMSTPPCTTSSKWPTPTRWPCSNSASTTNSSTRNCC